MLLDRERLRQLRLHMLEQLAVDHLDAGRHGEALQAALAAMAAEPLRETPHRLVVRIHLAEGNAFEAVHAFYVYRDLLMRGTAAGALPRDVCPGLRDPRPDPAGHPPHPGSPPSRSGRAA